jgi:glycosyltransferase involved in cell wall biosynthesis
VNPDITAVVPTHNRRELLKLTLRTILAQRDVDLQVVVVDDGSADDTGKMVNGFQDRRVHLIRHERATGVSIARNHGAAEATGKWLAFCDDDDLWAPDKLARQLAAAAEVDRKWAYGGAVRIDSEHQIMSAALPPPPEQVVERLPSWNLMPGGSSNVIVRADLFSRVGGWEPSLVNLADWDLWARLARHGLPARVDAPLVGYRIHVGNASGNTKLILREARVLDGRYGARLDYGELHRYLASVCLRSGRRWPALGHFVRAAARGQALTVAGTLAGLLRDRVANRVAALRPKFPTARGVWIAEAETWIAPLRDASRSFSQCLPERASNRASRHQ